MLCSLSSTFSIDHVEIEAFLRKITGAVGMMGWVTIFILNTRNNWAISKCELNQANSTLENTFSFINICQYYVS